MQLCSCYGEMYIYCNSSATCRSDCVLVCLQIVIPESKCADWRKIIEYVYIYNWVMYALGLCDKSESPENFVGQRNVVIKEWTRFKLEVKESVKS